MKYFVILIFLGISLIIPYVTPDTFGLWIPLSPDDLLEESKTVFVGTVTGITLVDREYQSQIAHDGTIKEEVGPETITLEEYTVNIEEFLKNPQDYSVTKVLGATVGGVPGGPAKISGFEIGDRVLFYRPRDQNQTHFPGQYLPESFKIPQQCDAKKVLEQPRIELGNSFDISQDDIAKQDNFTAGIPMKFTYSKDMYDLSGKSIDVEVSIRPYGEDEVIFEKNMHVESEPCTWIASAEWEFTPKEGNYRMYLGIRENESGEESSYTGFSVISENNTLDISPLKQFHSGILVEEIQCKDGLVLIQRHNGYPACIKPESKEKLTDRGWMTDPIFYGLTKSQITDIQHAKMGCKKLGNQTYCDEMIKEKTEYYLQQNKLDAKPEPSPEPEPMSESEILQKQKQQQAKIHTQEIIMTDYRGHEHQINAINEYRNEFEDGYFLEQFILPNKQNFEKGELINFVYVGWGYQPQECTSPKVEVFFKPYENGKIEKFGQWQKPKDNCFSIASDSDGYLIVDAWPNTGISPPHEICTIPGEYRVAASTLEDESKVEWGYFTCQKDKLVGEPQPWMELSQ